jgi:hypothetical protein
VRPDWSRRLSTSASVISTSFLFIQPSVEAKVTLGAKR